MTHTCDVKGMSPPLNRNACMYYNSRGYSLLIMLYLMLSVMNAALIITFTKMPFQKCDMKRKFMCCYFILLLKALVFWNEYKVMLKQYHYISNHLPVIIKILFVYKVPKYVKTMNELIFWWSFISNHVFHSFYTVKLKTLFKRFL